MPKGTRLHLRYAQIEVSLGRALATDLSPAGQIILFESLCGQNKNPDTRMGIWIFGTPKGTRTPDLLIRSQSLYPTELSAHVRLARALRYDSTVFQKMQVFFSFFSKIFLEIIFVCI